MATLSFGDFLMPVSLNKMHLTSWARSWVKFLVLRLRTVNRWSNGLPKGVQFPEEARGWILLNRAGLSGECRGHLQSSWKLEERVNCHSSPLLLPWSQCFPSESCCPGGRWDFSRGRSRLGWGWRIPRHRSAAGGSSVVTGGRVSRDLPRVWHRRGAGDFAAWQTTGTQSSAEEATIWQSAWCPPCVPHRSGGTATTDSLSQMWQEGPLCSWVPLCLSQRRTRVKRRRKRPLLLTMHRQVLPWSRLCHRLWLPCSPYLLCWTTCVCSAHWRLLDPGFKVLDSGCGKTIVGSPALAEFEKLWRQRGRKSPDRFNETHQFRFGNGEVDQPHWCSNAGLSWASLRCH